MTTSTYFRTILNTTITSIYPYPPATIVKHHFWYFNNADFFIIIRGIAYGLHRRLFEPSPYFRNILVQNEPGHDIPRGITVHLPIPFDKLSPPIFFIFLQYLYYPKYFIGTEEDWKNIRRLCLDWEFSHMAGITILKMLEMRRKQLPPVMKRLLDHNIGHTIWKEQTRRNKLHEILIEED